MRNVWIGLISLLLLCSTTAGRQASTKLQIPRRKYKLGVFTTYKPTICGIAQFSANMIKGLQDADPHISVEVFNIVKSYPQQPRMVGQVKITDVHCAPGTELAAFRRLAKYVKEQRFNGVIVNHEYNLISSYKHFEALVKLLKDTRTPVYTILHTPVSYPPKDKKAHVKRVAAHSTAVLAMSWKGKHYLHHSYGIPKKKIAYFPHGIKAAKPQKGVLRQFRIPAGSFVIYSDGILHPQKGIERVLRAMSVLKRGGRLGNIVLVLAGVNDKVRPYVAQLKSMISSFRLNKHVVWIPKFLSDQEMAALHQRSDIYITLFDEVIPTSGTLTYAMYLGDAIISTPYRYSLELLGVDNHPRKGTSKKGIAMVRAKKKRISHAGISVPFNNPAVLADMILLLKNQPSLARRLKRRARARVRGYSWKNVGRHLAYFLKTRQHVPVNPDPYTTMYLPSACHWKGESIVNFAGTPVAAQVGDGAFLLYADPFVKVRVEASSRRIRKMQIKGSLRKHQLMSFGNMLTLERNSHIRVLAYSKTTCYIATPNIIFVVKCSKRTKAITFDVLYENMYGSAVGGFGASLRQKYDLTKDSAPAFGMSKIGTKL